MVSAKIMWNSVISMPGAKFGGADINNMYLEMPLDQYEYMRLPLKLFPDDIIQHYNLQKKSTQWLRLHGDSTGRVRVTTSQHLSQQAPTEIPGSTRLL